MEVWGIFVNAQQVFQDTTVKHVSNKKLLEFWTKNSLIIFHIYKLQIHRPLQQQPWLPRQQPLLQLPLQQLQQHRPLHALRIHALVITFVYHQVSLITAFVLIPVASQPQSLLQLPLLSLEVWLWPLLIVYSVFFPTYFISKNSHNNNAIWQLRFESMSNRVQMY